MFFIWITLAHILQSYPISASTVPASNSSTVPASNASTVPASNVKAVHFVRGDHGRDTVSLLISCIVTLSLCLYSTVHPNIPPEGEPRYRATLKNVKWCMIGLFAPELVLYTAWCQYASARRLCAEVNKIASSDQSHKWTVTHGFYGTMGGIAFDVNHDSDTRPGIFGYVRRLTLTAEGVALLARCGHLPEISIADMKDKSKTDYMAKILVCVQVGWMVVQVISRWALNLPTTLLEVHTLAHAACALMVYIIWWHKLRNIDTPTLLQGEWWIPLAAYMYSSSLISTSEDLEFPGILETLFPVRKLHGELRTQIYVEEKFSTDDSSATVHDAGVTGRHTDVPSSNKMTRRFLLSSDEIREPLQSQSLNDTMESTRVGLASRAIATYPTIRNAARPLGVEIPNPFPGSNFKVYRPPVGEYLKSHCLNLDLNLDNTGLIRDRLIIINLMMPATSMVYGAIHISSWNYFFPTLWERDFWRLNSVLTTISVPLLVVYHISLYLWNKGTTYARAYNSWSAASVAILVIFLILFAPFALFGVLVIVSRIYMFVQAFVSIREVPKGVYVSVNWLELIPHG
jgi:hypothetical protein